MAAVGVHGGEAADPRGDRASGTDSGRRGGLEAGDQNDESAVDANSAEPFGFELAHGRRHAGADDAGRHHHEGWDRRRDGGGDLHNRAR